jgi:hypothetical protein
MDISMLPSHAWIRSRTGVRRVHADREAGRESVGHDRISLVGTLVEHHVRHTARDKDSLTSTKGSRVFK